MARHAGTRFKTEAVDVLNIADSVELRDRAGRGGLLFVQLAQVRGKVCKVVPAVPGFVSAV